ASREADLVQLRDVPKLGRIREDLVGGEAHRPRERVYANSESQPLIDGVRERQSYVGYRALALQRFIEGDRVAGIWAEHLRPRARRLPRSVEKGGRGDTEHEVSIQREHAADVRHPRERRR